VDQGTPAHQGFLRNILKCGDDLNTDRRCGLCVGGDYQEAHANQSEPLHNFTGFDFGTF
jgi:hypothetical protein